MAPKKHNDFDNIGKCISNVESQTLLTAHKSMHTGVNLPNADGSRHIKKNNDASRRCKQEKTYLRRKRSSHGRTLTIGSSAMVHPCMRNRWTGSPSQILLDDGTTQRYISIETQEDPRRRSNTERRPRITLNNKKTEIR